MRLVGWLIKYNDADDLTPTYLQEIDLHATADELRALALFLNDAANQIEQAQLNNQALNIGIDFDSEVPNAQVGLFVNVVRHETEFADISKLS
jgi:hypothetical protein